MPGVDDAVHVICLPLLPVSRLPDPVHGGAGGVVAGQEALDAQLLRGASVVVGVRVELGQVVDGHQVPAGLAVVAALVAEVVPAVGVEGGADGEEVLAHHLDDLHALVVEPQALVLQPQLGQVLGRVAGHLDGCGLLRLRGAHHQARVAANGLLRRQLRAQTEGSGSSRASRANGSKLRGRASRLCGSPRRAQGRGVPDRCHSGLHLVFLSPAAQ
mmetsp:Transcript_22248/g.48885  ORF Transcript_22248/g.48885 Transcript_22248/m.48885 type:complete len:215 (+) Transcript_22248:355-999(+)